MKDCNRLDKLVRKCVSVMGERVVFVGEQVEKRLRGLMQTILNYSKHPFHETLKVREAAEVTGSSRCAVGLIGSGGPLFLQL